MSGAIHPLPQYAFMAWCSVKKAQGQLYLYLLYKRLTEIIEHNDINVVWLVYFYNHTRFLSTAINTHISLVQNN
jgi:hypothetical protein